MLPLHFVKKHDSLKVLCLGAHCDDIEIGCGGTILKLREDFPDAMIQWIIFSGTAIRSQEFRASAKCFLGPENASKCRNCDFRDGFFPSSWKEIKECFEQIKHEVDPDVIFTHYREDLHQDHRIISELTWNTFRNHLVFEYEIPKFDGDLGKPNFYSVLPEATCNRKLDYILGNYASQSNKSWFTRDLFMALLRLRGMEVSSPTKFSEAFYARKMVV